MGRFNLAGLLCAALGAAPAIAGATDATVPPASSDGLVPHGPSSDAFPSHHFQWAPHSAQRAQMGVNFGLNQVILGGFNFALELRYQRLWLEYSTGFGLTLNDLPTISMTQEERRDQLHIYVPYTTGFGVGLTLVDELWVGVEAKTHRFDVTPPNAPRSDYQTYSVGPVIGYKFFIWKGLHINVYLRYWPNVASSLDDNKIVLNGPNGPTVHDAHAFDFFANAALGYAVDL